MKLLALSIDANIFDTNTAVAHRMVEYGTFLDELHIIVHTHLGNVITKIATNVHAYPTNCSKIRYIFRAYSIGKKILSKNGGWMIVSQDAITNIVAFLLRSRFHVPVEVQIHTDFLNPNFVSESFKNRFRSWLYMFSARRADRVRVVSHRIFESLVEAGVAKSKIVVLPIYVDAERIKNTTPDFRLHERYQHFEKIVLMVSRLTKEKNVPLALRALSLVSKDKPSIGLVIVGDGPERANLIRLAKKLGISDQVKFEGWQRDTISYFKTADVFLSTSLYEGYGMSLVEAHISDIPIISTDAGIAKEIGAQIVSNDASALSRALVENNQTGKHTLPPGLLLGSKSEYLSCLKNLWENGI